MDAIYFQLPSPHRRSGRRSQYAETNSAMTGRNSLFTVAASIYYFYRTLFCSSFCLHDRKQRPSHQHLFTSKQRRTSIQLSSSIEVYDNIFDTNTCSLLHELAVDHCNRCERGSIFLRSPEHKDRLTPLEKAMDTILETLNDTSTIVEYWSRSCYINIDAHADIDEDTLKQDGVLRCPKNAHVLYMQIANSGEAVSCDDGSIKRMGPTVVFPERRVAWGSVSPIISLNGEEEYVVDVENYWDEGTNEQRGHISSGTNSGEEVVIVPAKTGRLLRFDGRSFHAVPKPPHRYLMSKKELNAYLDEEDDSCDNEDDYWDEYDDFEEEETDLENLRSVLLFNTWPEGSSGPRGVVPDKMELDDVPDGIELYSLAYDEYLLQMEEKRHQSWQKDYGEGFESLQCNRVNEWKHVVMNRIGDGKRGNITVPLMGNPSRKGCNIKQDVLHGLMKNANLMFYDCEQVSVLDLKQND